MRYLLVLALLLLSPLAFAADTLLPQRQNLTQVGGSTIAIGQTTMSASLPVTIASNQTALDSNLTKVGGSAIAIGQGLMAASLPVAIASNQGALPSNITQVGGATISATNALFTQLTDGATAYVGTKTGQLPTALGQATMANGLAVTIASNQSAIPTTVGTATGSFAAMGTATNIAAAGTTVLTCKAVTVSVAAKAYQFTISGAASARCTLRYNNNASLTNFADIVTSAANPTVTWPCQVGHCAVTAGASGTQAFEASCTNFDAAANDFNCSVTGCSSASGC